jgi:hypothetical protein
MGNKIIGGKAVVKVLTDNDLVGTGSNNKNEIEGSSSINKSFF